MKALLLKDANDDTQVLVLFGQGGAVKACVPDEDEKITEIQDVDGNEIHQVEETPAEIYALLTAGETLSKGSEPTQANNQNNNPGGNSSFGNFNTSF